MKNIKQTTLDNTEHASEREAFNNEITMAQVANEPLYALGTVKTDDKKKTTRMSDEEFKKRRDYDQELVNGTFRFEEQPGGTLPFSFGYWKGIPIEKYKLKDGNKYSLPRIVARHLNETVGYPVHESVVDKDGNQIKIQSQWIRRCSFENTEFADSLKQRSYR